MWKTHSSWKNTSIPVKRKLLGKLWRRILKISVLQRPGQEDQSSKLSWQGHIVNFKPAWNTQQYSVSKIKRKWAVGMAQGLRVSAALPAHPCLVPRTHLGAPNVCNSSSRDSYAFFWCPRAPTQGCACKQINKNQCTNLFIRIRSRKEARGWGVGKEVGGKARPGGTHL